MPVFATSVEKLPAQESLLSILYHTSGVPPVLLGTVQLMLICDCDTAIAVNDVGVLGTVHVVAEAMFDAFPVPAGFIADTWYS